MLKLCILYALAGLGIEVVFTALTDPFKRQRQWVGKASVFFLPCYALAPIVFKYMPQWAWWERGAVYLVGIYLVEWFVNYLIVEEYGTHPSETSYRQGFHYKGLVNLEPVRIIAWFGAGLFLEWLY